MKTSERSAVKRKPRFPRLKLLELRREQADRANRRHRCPDEFDFDDYEQLI